MNTYHILTLKDRLIRNIIWVMGHSQFEAQQCCWDVHSYWPKAGGAAGFQEHSRLYLFNELVSKQLIRGAPRGGLGPKNRPGNKVAYNNVVFNNV